MPRTPRSRIYDGRFYGKFVDPFVAGLHGIVAEYVAPGSKVLDVGCGTGSLMLRLAPDAAEVVGVELSPAMAEYASRRIGPEADNVSVIVGDVSGAFRDTPDDYFDVATMALVLHEMPSEARVPVLVEVTRVAKRLLCLEYRVPMPWNVPGARNRLIEALAGFEHFGAFRDFCRRGGTAGITESCELRCRNLRYPDKGTFDVSEITLG